MLGTEPSFSFFEPTVLWAAYAQWSIRHSCVAQKPALYAELCGTARPSSTAAANGRVGAAERESYILVTKMGLTQRMLGFMFGLSEMTISRCNNEIREDMHKN